MRFRLVYDGPVLASRTLPASGEKPERAKHKFDMRRAFHKQLKNMWNQTGLSAIMVHGRELGMATAPWERTPLRDCLAGEYEMFGWNFVPMVVETFDLTCSLRILFLRREAPGNLLSKGDIDNRVKTIFDALRLPQNKSEMFGNDVPADDERPMFCLLRDDSLITHVEVETDTLWEDAPPEKGGADHCRVVIDVNLRPWRVTMFNLSFAGD